MNKRRKKNISEIRVNGKIYYTKSQIERTFNKEQQQRSNLDQKQQKQLTTPQKANQHIGVLYISLSVCACVS